MPVVSWYRRVYVLVSITPILQPAHDRAPGLLSSALILSVQICSAQESLGLIRASAAFSTLHYNQGVSGRRIAVDQHYFPFFCFRTATKIIPRRSAGGACAQIDNSSLERERRPGEKGGSRSILGVPLLAKMIKRQRLSAQCTARYRIHTTHRHR